MNFRKIQEVHKEEIKDRIYDNNLEITIFNSSIFFIFYDLRKLYNVFIFNWADT